MGTIWNDEIDWTGFQFDVTFSLIPNVSEFKGDLELLPVRYTNKPAQAILYHGLASGRVCIFMFS